jgi:hypothetical protein
MVEDSPPPGPASSRHRDGGARGNEPSADHSQRDQRISALKATQPVVFFPSTSPTVAVIEEGSFVRLALDYIGDACALDRAGEITCWPGQSPAGPLAPSALPRGPFTAIVGATDSFCAARDTGAIVCWGSATIEVPTDW